MNGMVLPIVTIGNRGINLLNICYWEVAPDDEAEIVLVFAGDTRCRLNAVDTQNFLQRLRGPSNLVTPGPGVLSV